MLCIDVEMSKFCVDVKEDKKRLSGSARYSFLLSKKNEYLAELKRLSEGRDNYFTECLYFKKSYNKTRP